MCRRAVLRIDGEVLSDSTFEPYLIPAVLDSRYRKGVCEGTAHLLDTGDVLTLSITDTVPDHAGGQREHRHDLLQVPLRGYSDVEARLSGVAHSIWAASVPSYAPPEFAPDLDPRLLDQTMRLISDPDSYAKWRASMVAQFVKDGSDRSSIDEAE